LAMMNVHRGHGIQSRPDQQGAAASKPPTGQAAVLETAAP
jgi:hypothetical protein